MRIFHKVHRRNSSKPWTMVRFIRMAIRVQFLLLIAIFPASTLASCADVRTKTDKFFSTPTKSTLKSFWSSFDKKCAEDDKQHVEERIGKCYGKNTETKACDLIYEKAKSECAVDLMNVSQTNCPSILKALLAVAATPDDKFMPLYEISLQHICFEPTAICYVDKVTARIDACKVAACNLYRRMHSLIDDLSKGSVANKVSELREIINNGTSDDPTQALGTVAENYFMVKWAPKNLTWDSAGCSKSGTPANDLICRTIEEKCEQMYTTSVIYKEFDDICYPNTTERPVRDPVVRVTYIPPAEYDEGPMGFFMLYGSSIFVVAILLLVVATSGVRILITELRSYFMAKKRRALVGVPLRAIPEAPAAGAAEQEKSVVKSPN